MVVIGEWIIQYDLGAKRVCAGNSGSREKALSCGCSVCLGHCRSIMRYSRAIGLGRSRGIGVRYLRVVEGYIYGGTDGGEYQKYD